MKIDEKGNYCEFRGMTVVAALSKEDKPIGEAIYNCIAGVKLASTYYSLLPSESYHMTAINLFTEEYDCENNWKEFVNERLPLFKQLAAAFSNTNSFVVTVTSVCISSVIQLILTIPEDQKKKFNDIAQSLNIIDKLPSDFHITLAYQYEASEDGKEETRVNSEIQSKLDLLLKNYEFKLNLNAPALCYFNDMTAFIPWNGESYPFQSSFFSSIFNLFKSHTPKKPSNDDNDNNCVIM